ncbi:MAG: HAD family phosphatase [Solirubrobacteraceae bacterium]|nr:HAD family phosphatase [Solirubrobacteraceae bacterium]
MAEAVARGLLFDWGGVLTTNLFAGFAAFCQEEGIDPGLLREKFLGDPEAQEMLFAFETGEMEEPEFERRLAALLGLAPERAEGFNDRIFDRIGEDRPMIEALRNARVHGLRTGLLSNSWGTHRYPRHLFGELFDAVVISGEEGMRKPDAPIYELAIGRMELPAHEIVFVDDLDRNLEPARELGLLTIHHRDTDETLAELERLTGVSLR